MVEIDARNEQMFPTLSADEIERLKRFGEIQHYEKGRPLLLMGEISKGLFVIISGKVTVNRRDPLGHLAPIMERGPGQFIGEVGHLSGQPALVDVFAVSDVEVLFIPQENLRALLIAEPEIGDRIMRALILRRIALIETGAGGPVLIGSPASPDMLRLQNFLARNDYPYQVLDPSRDKDAATIVQKYAPIPSDLPLAVCPKGPVLKNPSETELARALGMVRLDDPNRTYDVAVIGAGPAGLSTAVYAASEGLSVVVLESRAYGGQAEASSRIENYLGFPTGVSGHALMGRAFVQAQKFGAIIVIPAEVRRFFCSETPQTLELSDGRKMHARTTILATGARYRRLSLPHYRELEGRGIWYWASPIEARICRNEEVAIVGGGNSAGQAAVFLRMFASKVWMLVRGKSLAESMSQYLIDRIAAAKNIEVLTETEVVAVFGTPAGQLERIRWRHNPTGKETEKPIRNLFVMIGADPATDWLKDCGVALDTKGFVLTGPDASRGEQHTGAHDGKALGLESSIPGVFAIGDVRSGSVKRVGGAIGEGAAVVAQLHAALNSTGSWRRP